MTFVEHKPCAACGNPNTSFMFGSARSGNVFWLCGLCYSITPHAVGLALESNKRISEIDDGGLELQPDQTLARDERSPEGIVGPDVEGEEGR